RSTKRFSNHLHYGSCTCPNTHTHTHTHRLLKQAGVLKSSEANYGQMDEAAEPMMNVDGTPIVKEQKTYQDDTCKGRCLYYACCRCSKRYYTAWLSSLGFMITFGIRCNMAWAMLSMQSRHKNLTHHLHTGHGSHHLAPPNSTAHHFTAYHSENGVHSDPGHVVDLAGILNVTTFCVHVSHKYHNFQLYYVNTLLPSPWPPHGTIKKPDFFWTAGERGLVDSSFFYGYLITQIPGGVIAAKFPANKLFGIAVGGSAFLNLFLPSACRVHYGVVMAIRMMQGLVEGTSYPACHGIWRFWAPPMERSRLATIAFCGTFESCSFCDKRSVMICFFELGVALIESRSPTNFLSSTGIVGLLWFVWWWRVTFERPSLHPTISEAERNYIETSLGESPNIVESFLDSQPPDYFQPVSDSIEYNLLPKYTAKIKQKIPIPWGKFFTSMPVYAIIVANIARSWSFYLLITKSPKYFREVFGYNLAEVSCAVLFSKVANDPKLSHYGMGLITDFISLLLPGFGMEAVFLLGVGYSKSITPALVCLVLAVGFSGFAISGKSLMRDLRKLSKQY
ncbi:Vesicular glutamate transporter, partial [Fasciola gigantica]